MSLQVETARGILWSGVQSWGSRVISFAVFVVLARLISPEAFGLMALANVYIMFIQIFADQGFGTAIEQRHSIERGHLNIAFWSCFVFGLVILVLTVSFATLIAKCFGQPELGPILRVLSFSVLFSAVSGFYFSLLRRRLNFKAVAGCTIIANAIGGMIGISMAFANCGVWSLVAQQITYSCATTLFLWRITGWIPNLEVSGKHFKELFSFGVHITGGELLDFFNRRFDQLLIGYYLGPMMLGYYSVAYRLLLTFTELLTGVTNQVALPAFSRLQREPERMRRAFYGGVQLTSLISFPIFVCLALLAPQVVTTLFGEKWLPSAPIIQILSAVGLFHSVIWFNGTVTIAMGKPKWRLGLLAARTAVVVIAFTLVVQFGLLAVAATYVLVSYAFAPLEYWIVQRLIGIDLRTYFHQLSAAIFGSVVMGLVVWTSTSALEGFIGSRLLLSINGMLGIFCYLLTLSVVSRDLIRQPVELVKRSLHAEWRSRGFKCG
jgi:polysaccharide transporter, PST family